VKVVSDSEQVARWCYPHKQTCSLQRDET